MTNVSTLFWDIGGVVLSNGWDHAARAEAARTFDLDVDDFEQRHRIAEYELETGAISLDAYLDRTVFFRERRFGREEFRNFIFAQSHEYTETRVLLDALKTDGAYFMAALNNESLELNAYRIRRFDLTRNFSAFFSSCYLRVRKPDPLIYKNVLAITRRIPEECIFIDDRPPNLEPAKLLGLRTILFRSAAELRVSLAENGVGTAVLRGPI